jgi:hypothetical protein
MKWPPFQQAAQDHRKQVEKDRDRAVYHRFGLPAELSARRTQHE